MGGEGVLRLLFVFNSTVNFLVPDVLIVNCFLNSVVIIIVGVIGVTHK